MAKQTINIGTSPNKGNGDPLRTAFEKINANFNELYTLTGGTSAQLTELAQDYAAQMLVNGDHDGVSVEYIDADNKLNIIIQNIDGGSASTTYEDDIPGGGA